MSHMFKKYTAGFLLVPTIAFFTTVPVQSQAAEMPSYLSQGTVENLGNPLTQSGFQHLAFTTRDDGKIVGVTIAEGYGGMINIVDAETGENLYASPIGNKEHYTNAWQAEIMPNGHILIFSHSNGKEVKEDGTTKRSPFIVDIDPNALSHTKIEVPQEIFSPYNAVFSSATDGNGTVYFGTYADNRVKTKKGGGIFSYNYNTGEFKDYGVVQEDAYYVRSMTYENGKIYAGTGSGTENVALYEIDPKTGDKQKMPQQIFTDTSKHDFIYSLSSHNGYLYARYSGLPDGEADQMFVFDTNNKKWYDSIRGSYGGVVVPVNDNPNNDTVLYKGKKNILYSYNPKTKTSEEFSSPISGVLSKTSRISDGRYALYNSSEISIYDKNTNTTVTKNKFKDFKNESDMFVGANKKIDVISNAVGNDIWVAPYAPTDRIWRINPYENSKKINDNPNIVPYNEQQVQDISVLNDDWLITSAYTGAYIKSTKVDDTVDREKWISKPRSYIGNNQVRPKMHVKMSDTKLAVTSDPDYGFLTGGISVYDLENNSIKYFDIPNFSPRVIEYKDGFFYIGAATEGGLGAKVKEPAAKIFKMNAETGEIVKEMTPVSSSTVIPDILFSPDGRLFFMVKDQLFELNPDTFEIINKKVYSPTNANLQTNTMEWGYDGIIAGRGTGKGLTDYGNEIFWIDPDNFDNMTKLAEGHNVEISEETGDIYYVNGDQLYRYNVPIEAKEINNPVYKNISVKQGESKNIAIPRDNGRKMHKDTTFGKPKGFPEWAHLYSSGAIKISPDKSISPGKYEIPVVVRYPDGSSERIYVNVTIEAQSNSSPTSVSPTDQNISSSEKTTTISEITSSDKVSSIITTNIGTSAYPPTTSQGNTIVKENEDLAISQQTKTGSPLSSTTQNKENHNSTQQGGDDNLPTQNMKETQKKHKNHINEENPSLLQKHQPKVHTRKEPTQQQEPSVQHRSEMDKNHNSIQVPIRNEKEGYSPNIVQTPGSSMEKERREHVPGPIVDTGGELKTSIWRNIFGIFR